MAKIALYQKYRSSTFEEVVGQEYIVKSIKNAVKENKVGHAYLFCGPRGTGKTTMARLLAKCLYSEGALMPTACAICETLTASYPLEANRCSDSSIILWRVSLLLMAPSLAKTR